MRRIVPLMGTVIIKPDRNEDFYVGWSTGVEAPVWFGNRVEAAAFAAEDAQGERSWSAETRLAYADQHGSSVAPELGWKFGYWATDGFIYEQRGVLPRTLMIAACERLAVEDEPGVWDLLEPFDDGTEVRRG